MIIQRVFNRKYGAVLGGTIDKFIYLTANKLSSVAEKVTFELQKS